MTMVALALLGVSGCVRAGFDLPGDGSVADVALLGDGSFGGFDLSEGEAVAVTTLLLADDFEDGKLDRTLWWSYNNGTMPVPVEGNGQLSISPPANASCLPPESCYGGIGSQLSFSFVNTRVQVEAVQVISAVSKGDMALQVHVHGSSGSLGTYAIFFNDGLLSFGYRPPSTTTWDRTDMKYAAATHRHWRISQNPADNSVRFSTSRDGTDWTLARSMPNKVDLSQVGFSIDAGVWGSVPSPGIGIFDNFRAERMAP